jgi:hypothetical protein
LRTDLRNHLRRDCLTFPVAPRSFPSATAAGFLAASLSGNGDSGRSPMACPTTCGATVRNRRFGTSDEGPAIQRSLTTRPAVNSACQATLT